MNTKKILVEIWSVVCHPTGYQSQTYVMAGDGYGQLLGRTAVGEIAEFNSWEDPVFNEALDLVKELFPLSQKTGAPFQEILGFVCDLAPSGSKYSFAGEIYCPECGTNDVSYGPAEPPEFREMEIPQVSHKNWDQMNTPHKKQLLQEALIKTGWITKI